MGLVTFIASACINKTPTSAPFSTMSGTELSVLTPHIQLSKSKFLQFFVKLKLKKSSKYWHQIADNLPEITIYIQRKKLSNP